MNRRNRTIHYLKVTGWMILWIFVVDIAINIFFQSPTDLHARPSRLQDYFDYGRSVEGKLDRITRPSVDASAPRVSGGWLNSGKYKSLPAKISKPGEILIALYGMSHTQELWKAIRKTDKRFIIRGFMSAGAPPNWSYAAYEIDRGRHNAHVVILGILTDSIAPITSTTGMTAFFDASFPYTFPRYKVKNEKLISFNPSFNDAKGYIEYFYDKTKWKCYRNWLYENDKYYNSILFKRSILDKSAFIRLFLRAYAERVKQRLIKDVYTSSGFNEDSEEIVTLRTIVKTFAESVREDNMIPIIYIANSQGSGDHLYKALKPVLDLNKIPYLTTHIICPPDDPQAYLSVNGHFTPSKDLELAKEMINIIENEIEKK